MLEVADKPAMSPSRLSYEELGWLAAAWLAFLAARPPWPLFYANQNTYLLHGLAAGGYRHLASDWLARSADPFPVFSAAVALTVRYLHPAAFQVGQAVLVALYLWSLVILADHVFPIRATRARLATFLGLLIVLHAEAINALGDRLMGVFVGDLLVGGVAAQRVLSTYLEPSNFGVLLLVSLALHVRGRTVAAAMVGATACVMHASYVPAAAALLATYAVVAWQVDGRPRLAWAVVLAGAAITAPSLVYVLRHFSPTSPEATRLATAILLWRFPHHALPAVWFRKGQCGLQIAIMLSGVVLSRRTRLLAPLGALAASGAGLSALYVLTHSGRLAMAFPWRVSVLLVPIGATLLMAWAVTRLDTPKIGPALGILTACAVLAAATFGLRTLEGRVRHRIDAPEFKLMRAVGKLGGDGQVWLIPPDLEDFRLNAGVPVVADLKSHPYRDTDVCEWFRRYATARKFYSRPTGELLARLIETYGVTHVVLEAPLAGGEELLGEKVYDGPGYTAWRVR
jgi:hypothetical protein